MARLREVYSVQDFSGLDEPVMLLGPIYLSWRRLAYLSIAVLLAAALLSRPSAMLLPGVPLGLDQLLLLGVSAALTALGMAPRKAVDPEIQILYALLRPKGPRRPPEPGGPEEVMVETDTLPAAVEISGYAVDPATGEPYRSRVIVETHTLRMEVEPDQQGRYTALLELGPGEHEITVKLAEPPVTLKSFVVRVVERR